MNLVGRDQTAAPTAQSFECHWIGSPDGEWLTMSEAAVALGFTHHITRRLIRDKLLAAEQIVPGAPYQIRAFDLQADEVWAAVKRRTRACRSEE